MNCFCYAMLAIGMTVCALRGLAQPQHPVTLGAVYNVTGQQAVLDQTSVQGAMLAAKGIEFNGQPLELIILNGQSDVDVTSEAVTEFFKKYPTAPALMGVSDSDLALAAAEPAEASGRVFLTSGATSPKLPGEMRNIYLACFGDNVQAAAAGQWAYETKGVRKVAVVFDPRYTYTRLLHGYFQEAFQDLGGSIVSVTPIDLENHTLATQDIADAEMIFLSTEATHDAVQGIQILRKAGFTQPIIGGDGYDTPTVWAKNAELGDIYYTTHAYVAADNPDPRVVEFYNAYVAEYEGLKPDSFSALGYDTVGLLIDAIKRAGSTDPVAVREALGKTEGYEGITGTISYVDGSHIPKKNVALLAVDDGKVSLVEEVMPKHVPLP